MIKNRFIKSFCIAYSFAMLLVCPITAIPANAICNTTQPITLDNETIQPRAAIIEWVYKEIDGKIYRRLFNHQTKEYIGEWIPIN